MAKIALFAIILFSYSLLHGQESLKGYYINNDGKTVNGYFLKGDFAKANLLKFSTDAEGDFKGLDSGGISEYGLDENLKYKKYTVNIDSSNLIAGVVSKNKNPEWVSKTVFLNVILEGDASLYSYFGANGTLFFYNVASKSIPVTQLVFKKYMADELHEAENTHYRQQLFNDVKCNGQTVEDFYSVDYRKAALTKVFLNYNACAGSASKTYTATKNNRLKVNFTIFAGINTSKITFEGADPQPADNKDAKTNFGFGGEVALLIPSRKASLFIRADYEKVSGEFSHEEQTNFRYTKDTYIIDVSLVNFYFGVRYNLYLNPKNHLFADVALASGFPSGTYTHNNRLVTRYSTADYKIQQLELGKDAFWNIGIGYMFNDKYGADLRIDTPRNFFNNYLNNPLDTNSLRLGLNLRYTIN